MNERRHITVSGVVQGVGFRPFVYRLAQDLRLSGWVINSSQGVVIEVEASADRLNAFLTRMHNDLPPHAAIHHCDWHSMPPLGDTTFDIRHSEQDGAKTALVLPDLATCPECLKEIFDPGSRRYRYPFTNCTHCGPRFTIIQDLPYDRPKTTMRDFVMCEACRAEYENPLDRRFHAQPNACPHCGPQLALWETQGRVLAQRDDALRGAIDALWQGRIVAVKGLGGFHLMVDGRDEAAVARLRARKHRYDKPLAVMYPSLEAIKADCEVSALEETLLTSAQAPIVLLKQKSNSIASNVVPGNPWLGVMLPYTPLHHLIMHDLGCPVVATSGNLSGEPICTDEHDALHRLAGIADLFLVHNRPIERHVDDSIVRVVSGREMILRRARGYAPLPVVVSQESPTLIAVGPHMKNTAAVTQGQQVFLSQHIGDLDTVEACAAHQRVIHDFQQLYDLHPTAIVCDLHPDYRSTQFAEGAGLPLLRVQHHYAHVLSCMADHQLEGTVLGIAWDGTGYGTDGTIWGGEFLRITKHGFERRAHLMPFRLPGGEQAVKEPRRAALGLLYAVFGEDIPADLAPWRSFTPAEHSLLMAALRKGLNAPLTTSAGRLFDAVAALIGLRQHSHFEGQAAMDLEFAQQGLKTDTCYPFAVTDSTHDGSSHRRILDLRPTITELTADVQSGTDIREMAAMFHNTMTEMIVTLAREIGEPRVVLTGGCFQNKTLLEHTIDRLSAEGFQPYWHHHIPPNDGGIALGQIMAALKERTVCASPFQEKLSASRVMIP